jgi:hypothetical protein
MRMILGSWPGQNLPRRRSGGWSVGSLGSLGSVGSVGSVGAERDSTMAAERRFRWSTQKARRDR